MYKTNKAQVTRGQAGEVAATLVDPQGNAFFTCGLTGITMRIENEDGSFLEKAASTGTSWGLPEKTYMYIFGFTPEETALFKVGSDLSVWLKCSFGVNDTKYEMARFLTVMADLY
jgi:hypothetical protein